MTDEALARFRARTDETAAWPHRVHLDFANLDRQTETMRAIYQALAGAPLAERPTVDDFWTRLYTDPDGDGLLIDAETYNYGLEITTTRYTLVVAGACVRTTDVDSDNCAPEGGAFDLAARSPEALERAVAALVAWHHDNGGHRPRS